jgi:hypothetical protein
MLPRSAARVVMPAALATAMLAGCGGATASRHFSNADLRECAMGGGPARCLRLVSEVTRLHSLRLTTSVPELVGESCRAAGRGTALRVVCPPIVPAGGAIRGLSGPQIVTHNSYSMSINNGQNPGRIHWEIGAIRGPATRLWVFDRPNWASLPPKAPVVRIAQPRYLGHLVTLWRFPDNDGQLEGHDAAFASEGGITYFVSIHGHDHDDADIAMLLAILARAPS